MSTTCSRIASPVTVNSAIELRRDGTTVPQRRCIVSPDEQKWIAEGLRKLELDEPMPHRMQAFRKLADVLENR